MRTTCTSLSNPHWKFQEISLVARQTKRRIKIDGGYRMKSTKERKKTRSNDNVVCSKGKKKNVACIFNSYSGFVWQRNSHSSVANENLPRMAVVLCALSYFGTRNRDNISSTIPVLQDLISSSFNWKCNFVMWISHITVLT